ncbi:MAG: glycosyltransferase family 4 protein [Myxococcota bacterium]|nr:glycosyltransferase family 4 protein [Myxococcota bacterium]
MRILIFSYEYPPFHGGAGVYAWELARGLRARGAQVTVLSASWPEASGDGTPGTEPGVHRFGDRHTKSADVLRALDELRRQTRADRVLVADRRAHELLARLDRVPFPYVVTLHGTEVWWYFDPERAPFVDPERRARDQRLLRRADGIIAVSRATAGLLASYAPDLAGRTRVVHNGISPDRCRLASGHEVEELRGRLGAEGRRVLLSVGRLDQDKGQDVALHAFRQVANEETDALLLLVGDGPEREALEALAVELGVRARTRFLGEVGDSELSACLGLCDVFLLPSRCERRFEGLGLVFLEAGACGKPVVAGAVGGVPEAVVHEQNGLLVAPSCPREVAAAVLRLLRDAAERERLGECGRERVREHFNSERMAGETLAFLEELGARRVPRLRVPAPLTRGLAAARRAVGLGGARP